LRRQLEEKELVVRLPPAWEGVRTETEERPQLKPLLSRTEKQSY
jgi:hypothetical protein